MRIGGGASASPAGTCLVEARYILTRALDDNRVETLEHAAILVENGRIAAIGPVAELAARHPGIERLGGPDALICPGFVNGHHHIGLTPVQLGSPDLPLELWLTHAWQHRDVDPYLDTLYSAFELIASGVTAVQHLGRMKPAPVSAWPEEASAVITAYRDIGMRVSFALCNRDQHRLVYAEDEAFIATLPADLQAPTRAHLQRAHFRLEDYETDYLQPMIERFGLRSDPLVRLWLAPINLERASDRLLRLTRDWSERYGMGIHLHLAETPYQKEFARRRFGKSAVAHLADLGMLGPQLTLGHGTWLDERDLDLIHDHGVCVCHNASSNLRLKSGIAPITEVVRRGIPVALGIDEAGLNDDRDMLQEMRLVKHLHGPPGLDTERLTPAQIFRMATEHGARAAGFGEEIGSLAIGKRADLVVLDYARIAAPYLSPATDPVSALIYRAKTAHVRITMIEGRVVYRDGQFPGIDRDATMAAITAHLDRPPHAHETARAELSARLLPHLAAFYRDWPLPAGEPWYRLNAR